MTIRKIKSYIIFIIIIYFATANQFTFSATCPDEIRQKLTTSLKCEDLTLEQQSLCCDLEHHPLDSINTKKTLEGFILNNEVSQFEEELKKQKIPLQPEEVKELFQVATADYPHRSIDNDRKFMSSLLSYYEQNYPGCINNYLVNNSHEDLIITTSGIRSILRNFMNAHPSFPFAPIGITEDLQTTLRKLRRNKDEDVNQAIIFNRKEARPSYFRSLHTSMLLIRRTKGKCSVINVDSFNKNQDYLDFVIKTVHEQMPQCKIYSFETSRQSDKTNCPLFTISDYLEHSKNSLFDYVDFIERKERLRDQCQTSEADGATTSNEEKMKQLKFFPPNFMSLTQSLEKINQYVRDSSEGFDQDSFTDLLNEVYSQVKVIPHKDTNEMKETNLAVHNRLKNFLNFLLSNCINIRQNSN